MSNICTNICPRGKMVEWRPASLFHIYFNIKGIILKEQMTLENITTASYNNGGLTNKLKKVQLGKDLKFYNVDVCCVQETKITEGIDNKMRWLPPYLLKNKPKRLRKWIPNTHKIWTAYTQSMDTKQENIDPGNTNETTICMYAKWESKNNHQ